MTTAGKAISIRRAVPADAPALAVLRYDFRAALGEPTEERAAFLERAAAWMRPRLAPAGEGCSWLCWLAERRSPVGAIVGNLWLQLLEKIPNPLAETEWHGYVSNFYVLPEARGGVGSLLLDEAIAEARRRGLDRVVLWQTPRSRSLYERHGFGAPGSLLELSLGS